MKKIQSVFCITLLSTILVGNAFASGAVGGSVFGFFDDVVNAFVALVSGDCPPRQCQQCRPTEVVDENGNCRPKED